MEGKLTNMVESRAWDHLMDLDELIATANYAILGERSVILVHTVDEDMTKFQRNGTVLTGSRSEGVVYEGDLHVTPEFVEERDVTKDWYFCEKHMLEKIRPR